MTFKLSGDLEIRNFQEADWELLGGLYESIKVNEDTVFWWVGDEGNWENVFCAFENGMMIGKGQVGIVNIVPPGRSAESKHTIYLNLKTRPDRENDYQLLEKLYEPLLARAETLKFTLPSEYETLLCVGNDSSETANSGYFTKLKGYQPLNSLFKMKRDLTRTIADVTLEDSFTSSLWKMETSAMEQEYLDLEAEVWPETPMGVERLAEYKQKPLWTSMVVREGETIVGGLMAWREEDGGCIEDVFVRTPWRSRGVAKYLLTQALDYFRANELKLAYLMVLTSNSSALSLYEAVGFVPEKVENRYYIELK